MADQGLNILQVSTRDNRGGAAAIAWGLHQAYHQRGLHTRMAVGQKFSDDVKVQLIPNDEGKSLYTRGLFKINRRLPGLNKYICGTGRLAGVLNWLAEPHRQRDIHRGIEDFHHPGIWRLFELFPDVPDILHCHNLHGGYIDLRILPWLSQQVPVVLTLHDAWLLSGHCAHSFDCERWKTGCGQCPDLTIYPAIQQDATAYNWRRKQDIYARSKLYVATPSAWLMQKVEQSILASGVIETRVIPHGVDLSIFQQADKQAVRTLLNIPQAAKMLLFTATDIRGNIWKDYQTMRTAIVQVAKRLCGQDVLFIALGEDAPTERIGQAEIRFVPYQRDASIVARYYQAADVYIHAAKVDTFPNVVLEALACGTPVVATAVGGIPEQVKSLERTPFQSCQGLDEATGILVSVKDVEGMADGIVSLLTNNALCRQLGENAAQDARERFNMNSQVEAYLAWYHEIIARWSVQHAKKDTSS